MKELFEKVKQEFPEYDFYLEDGNILAEEYWEHNGCKNDDDCCDNAQEIGEEIVKKFPELEIFEYYCHRHKYSIVELKLKTN